MRSDWNERKKQKVIEKRQTLKNFVELEEVCVLEILPLFDYSFYSFSVITDACIKLKFL